VHAPLPVRGPEENIGVDPINLLDQIHAVPAFTTFDPAADLAPYGALPA
jgi:hypothetical protein